MPLYSSTCRYRMESHQKTCRHWCYTTALLTATCHPRKRHGQAICTTDELMLVHCMSLVSSGGCCASRLPTTAKSFGSSCPPEMTGLDSPSSSSCRELMHGQQLDCSSSCTTDTIKPVSASTSISKVQIINSNHVPLQAPPQNKSGHCHKSPAEQQPPPSPPALR